MIIGCGIVGLAIGRKFTNEGYKGLDSTRIEIFSRGINLLQINPFFGIGATSFTEIYRLETGFWKGHSHNLLIELAISYGLPATVIFFTTINIILSLSCLENISKALSPLGVCSTTIGTSWLITSFVIGLI